MHLYSRKVLIKEKCQELLPHYLRFVKGVVDCEDLPLNISRENYQDSGLIAKLRNVLSRRIIKMLDDEAKRDPEKYKKWYNDFGMFIKEGIAVDSENKDALFKLLRFESRNGKAREFKSLEDYIAAMQPGQEKIYFLVNPNFDLAVKSPFLEPFRGSKIDVLILSNNVDEILFQQNGDFKGKRFINVESSYDEISKDLGKGVEDEVLARGKIPEEDITPFCLWVKNELSGLIGKVQISRRLKDTPAIMSGQMSSSMRLMMQMMEQNGQNIQNQNLDQIAQEQTLELNTSHPMIVNLNTLRKKNKIVASLVCRQLLDNVMVASGIPYNIQEGTDRQYKMLNSYLELALNLDDGPSRKIEKQSAIHTEDQGTSHKKESALNQAQKLKQKPEEKVVFGEHVVSDKDLKQ